MLNTTDKTISEAVGDLSAGGKQDPDKEMKQSVIIEIDNPACQMWFKSSGKLTHWDAYTNPECNTYDDKEEPLISASIDENLSIEEIAKLLEKESYAFTDSVF